LPALSYSSSAAYLAMFDADVQSFGKLFSVAIVILVQAINIQVATT
jgi:hypothetical protein